MSNPEMSAERRDDRDPRASGEESRDELKSILDTIAAQLQDADRRHTAALTKMQERISGMGREADSLRVRIPGQFAPAIEQIEAGISELARRLADAGQSGLHASGRMAQADSHTKRGRASNAMGGRDTDALNPWDQSAADALATAYESSGFAAQGTPSRDDGIETGGTSKIDEAWLESRFAEIARGIEYSLANVKPETDHSDFGDRFDHFERQFAKLFAGVATHDDLTAVRQIETHMENVVVHLEKTNDQLDRLNTIEMQIANVSKTLAEMQASRAVPADIDAVARAVAEETARRFAARQSGERNAAADELRPLIDQLMTENRQGGEQTAALLDTMQQAMVRLLDRADAIDAARPAPQRVFEAEIPLTYGARIDMFGSDVVRDEDMVRSAYSGSFDEVDDDRAHSDESGSTSLSSLGESGMSPEEMALRSEKLRQEFIADARRAKMRLSTESSDIEAAVPPSLTATRSYGAATAPTGSRPIRPSSNVNKNTSGPSAPSPLLMIVAGVVLAALAGLWYAFGFESTPGPATVQQAAPATTQQKSSAATGGVSDETKSAPDASETPAGAQTPSSKGDVPPPNTNGPRGDLAPGSDNHAAIPASDDQASAPRTALPMLGVAVDLNRPMTEAELLQARRHQVMANISGELGNAAARPGESAVVPPSMVPTEAETEGIAPKPQNDEMPRDAMKSSAIDMPSAMVGPLSLRLAAANGDASAQFEVGARFAEAEGVKQDFTEAAKWYQRSAAQGFAQAQYRLGTLYERGFGVKTDRAQATTWYVKAAEQGNIKAMHNLAVLSANQTDRAPDYTTAAQWFEQAAKRGLPDSQFNLAILYENGLGVTRDLKQAFLWLSLAAQGGDEDAVRRRDILRGKMTKQDLAQAQKMISAWRMTPSDRAINDALAAGELWKRNPKNGANG